MLELFNRLRPFFEDTHKEYSVREYGRICKISPPTASTFLRAAVIEGLLISRGQGIYIYYRANRDNSLFKDLSKTYWRKLLKDELKDISSKDLLYKKPILFGSIVKGENTSESDIDLFIDIERRNINLSKIESKLKRKIQVHFKESLKNENLKKNIEKGEIIE